MKLIALPMFLSCALLRVGARGAPVMVPPISVLLASRSNVERAIDRSLVMRLWGDASGFEVEVTSTKPVRGCFPNLVHWAAHGPDPSEVLPWQVAARRFSDTRLIPVCGESFSVEVSLVSPVLTADAEHFASGTLVVSVEARKQVARDGN